MVVADFGLARSVALPNRGSAVDVDASSSPGSIRRSMFRRNKCKSIVGNPFSMAPEMIHGFTYDEKVDVFSFGMIVCEVNSHRLALLLCLFVTSSLTLALHIAVV